MNNEKYEIIYTDPPWPQTKTNFKKARPKQTKYLDYPTMSVEDCFRTQDRFFAQAADKHNIFMWTIDKFLHETENQMAARGYKLHARLIWDKVTGIPAAFTVRYSHEYLLWFYKPGHILMPRKEARGAYSDVMREKVVKHSKKPECAYLMLEDMFPTANKIELFARNTRDGWISWGNELDDWEVTSNVLQLPQPQNVHQYSCQ